MTAPGRSARTVVLDAARRVYPGLDTLHWRLTRERAVRAALRGLTVPMGALARTGTRRGLPPMLLVVPDLGPRHERWGVAGGSIFFEVWQSAREVLGDDRVTLFEVSPDETERSWHARLLETLAAAPYTHVVTQLEEDPERRQPWSWDIVLAALARSWDGAVVGMLYDSGYPWLTVRAHRAAGLLPSLVLADLSKVMDGVGRRGRLEVGPVTMPISAASLRALDETTAATVKDIDVSFIGALYDYRIELLDRLAAEGLRVAVNPHRTQQATTYDESRTNMPTYREFMTGLARSHTTINFSRAAAVDHEQYKIRMVEASLMRCLGVTDDTTMSRRFFAPDEFASFSRLEDLPRVLAGVLADPERLAQQQEAARARALVLAGTDFWGQVDRVLAGRGLDRLTGVPEPIRPT